MSQSEEEEARMAMRKGREPICGQPHMNSDSLRSQLGQVLQQSCLKDLTREDNLTYNAILIDSEEALKSLTSPTFSYLLQKLSSKGMFCHIFCSAIRIALGFSWLTFLIQTPPS